MEMMMVGQWLISKNKRATKGKERKHIITLLTHTAEEQHEKEHKKT
jgi:hypothetical protein